MSQYKKLTFISILVVIPALCWASPCQLCEATTSRELPTSLEESLNINAGLQLQYDYRNEAYQDGKEVKNIDSSQIATTLINIYAGWAFTESTLLDLNLPVISRAHASGNFGERESTRDTGIGDTSIILRGFPFINKGENSSTQFSLRAGVTLPTGDDSNLKLEDEQAVAPLINGRDLSFGTGSVNYVAGANLAWQYGRWSNYIDAQYRMNTEGSYDFQYGNQAWVVGNFSYAVVDEDNRTSLGLNAIYKHLDNDEHNNQKIEDSGSDTIYLGPSIAIDILEKFSLLASYNIPVSRDVNGSQLVDAYLLQVSAVGKF